MQMKRILLLFVFLACISVNTFSQLKSELKQSFFWAETFVLYEEYSDALPLYELLQRVYPENNNFKYRTGQCLLNIPGRKDQAITYLEEAVKHINPRYREGKYREKGAPYDAYYYLANAYRINYQLDKAIDTYNLFLKNMNQEVYDSAVVNQQIRSCHNAMELLKDPLYIKRENLGSVINDRYPDLNPVVSGDETVMVYNKSEPFQDALYFTKKVDGKWTTPVNIIPDLGLGFENKNYATSLSENGRELYIYRPGPDYDGNIFVTKRLPNDRWTVLEKLNENINTKFWESHATISHDGKKLYFTSNRKGTLGGLDIYVSEMDSTGNWGPAKNMGPTINTIYNEESPFPGEDDNTLYFSSQGHYNMGGYDVFYSTLMANGEWSVPLNVGYPLNTPDDDVFFNPIHSGQKAYYALTDDSGFGSTDIYRIEIFSKDHPRKFYIMGIVAIEDLLDAFRESVKISTYSKTDPDSKVVVYSDPQTGEYSFELSQGEYTSVYEASGTEKIMQDLIIPINHEGDSIIIPGVLLKKTDFNAGLDVQNDMNITVVNGDAVEIRLKTEPNSILNVEHWLNDSLINSGNFTITDTVFIYRAVPGVGVNRIKFTLTDRFNNSSTSEVVITRKRIMSKPRVLAPPEPVKAVETPVPTEQKPEPVQQAAPAAVESAAPEKSTFTFLWILLGAGAIFLFFILFRRRKKKDEEK